MGIKRAPLHYKNNAKKDVVCNLLAYKIINYRLAQRLIPIMTNSHHSVHLIIIIF